MTAPGIVIDLPDDGINVEQEVKVIWFWQTRRFLDEGWTLNRMSFRSHWFFWDEAFFDIFRPTACRSRITVRGASPSPSEPVAGVSV